MEYAEASSTQSEQLARKIRGQIIDGQFAPGKKLPTFQEIESHFKVSRGVVQLAVERLKRDGFVNSLSRRGLFVVPHPPHLRRYGVVLPAMQNAPLWSRFSDALVSESQRMEQTGEGRQFEIFAGTKDQDEGSEVCARLAREVKAHRLAGLILDPLTVDLINKPPFNDPKLPKVYVFGTPAKGQRPIVSTDGQALFDRALGWLKARGRKRVAMVHLTETFSSVHAEDFARNGLSFRPQWRQEVGRGHPKVVAGLIPLLMDYPENERPDGLFIADDNLVEYASSALVSMGLRVGIDLDIVAHCNWPWPVPSAVPMQRIGYHAGHLLERCVEIIDAQRAGEPFDDVQVLPALFEDEAQ